MALDPRFVLAPSLQDFIIDKATGLPNSGGLVYFFQDTNVNNLKSIYELSGNPPDYTYTPLPNPLVLSSVGTFQDTNGADIIPYYFPYEGSPDNSTGHIDLYYIVVKNAQGTILFTRHAWPNLTDNPATLDDFINYSPNGQFLLHNDFASNSAFTPDTLVYTGLYSNAPMHVLPVAPGGWSFISPAATTGTYVISFNREIDLLPDPISGNPRYLLKLQRTNVIGSAEVCDIRIRFMNAFKFWVPSSDPTFTLLFSASSASVIPNLGIYFIRYFGVGGSASTETQLNPIDPVNVTSVVTQFAVQFTIPNPGAGNVGSNDDDFIEIAFRIPALTAFDIELTSIALAPLKIGPESNFPIETNGESVLAAMSNLAQTTNPITNAYYPEDGSNLFLPVIMTPKGFTYDYSQIATIVAKMTPTAINNELLCNGLTYFYNDYSSLGIPYKRLGDFLFNSAINGMQFGGGTTYVNTYTVAANNMLMISGNQTGLQTNPTAGTTTFNVGDTTVTGNSNSGSAGLGFRTYAENSGAICYFTANCILQGNTFGNVGVTDVDTGFSISGLTDPSATFGSYQFVIGVNSAAAALPGKSFQFANTTTKYQVWFYVGGGVAPVPPVGYTLVQCNLDPLMDINTTAIAISNFISGFQNNAIHTVNGAAITAGQYFTFTNNAQEYVVWYKVNGTGTQPVVAGTPKYIESDILSGDTDIQVAFKTQTAINKFAYGVPDLRGMFLRGNDPTGIFDKDFYYRYGFNGNLNPATNGPGTFELDEFREHLHVNTLPDLHINGIAAGPNITFNTTNSAPVGTPYPLTISNGLTGRDETRPVNVSVNYYIKY